MPRSKKAWLNLVSQFDGARVVRNSQQRRLQLGHPELIGASLFRGCCELRTTRAPLSNWDIVRAFRRLTAFSFAASFSMKRNSMDANTTTEPVISITENAAEEIKAMQSNPENAGKTLRVYVEQGGCSGMQYSLVFDEKRPDDSVTEMHGVCVLVDPFSAQYLRGTVVDFSDALTGGGFKLNNPNASQSCGCGKSFQA